MEAGCPRAIELEALALRSEALEHVRAHVRECSICREQVEEIRENELFLREGADALIGAIGATSASQNVVILPPDGTVRGYQLLEEISRGGQGIVYRAVQTTTKRAAAVKMLLGGAFATERQRARFDREIEIAASLRHPNIVTVFESGETGDGRRYVAMEFVDGISLDQYVHERLGAPATGGRARVDEAMKLMGTIAAAVGHAHSSGMMHRDLKPSNIFVDKHGAPRILDFGLARAIEAVSGVMTTLEFVGTPAFAAPEQFAGGATAVDARADVFALGLIIYRVLTGTMPYPIDGPIAALARHATSTDPVPPSRHISPLPGDVETIVLKCLAKDPARRYRDAGALASDIADYLAGHPIAARRDSALYVLRTLARRHRGPVAAGAMMLLTIIGAAVGLGVLAGDLDSARRRAEAALASSTVQRARLMATGADVERAERLLWEEAHRAGMEVDDGFGGSPERRRAAWALMELYAHVPRVFRVFLEAHAASIGFTHEGKIWAIDVHGRRFWWSPTGEALPSTPWESRGAEFGWSSQNGQHVLALDAGFARMLDLEEGRVVSGPSPWPKDERLVAISDDGRLIASARGKDQVATLTDARTLKTIGAFEAGARDISLNRCGERDVLLVTRHCHRAQCIVVRESPDWEVTHTVESLGSNGNLLEPMLFSDGSELVAGFSENIIAFDLSDPPAESRRFIIRSHTNSIRINEARGLLAAGSMEGTLTLLRLRDFSHVGEVRNGRPGQIALSADGGRMASVDSEQRVSVYESTPGVWRERIESSPTTHASIAVSRQGAVSWVDDSGDLFIRDAVPPHNIRVVRAHEGVATSVDWSPDGSRLLTGGFDGRVREWNRDGSPVRTVAQGLARVWCARYSPDGRAIAVGDGAGESRAWVRGPDADPLVFRTGGDRVPDLAFTPDGTALACVSIKENCIVWDLVTGRERFRLIGHGSFVRTLAFSPEGAVIATGGDDRAVRIWDASHGTLRTSIEGLPWGPFDIAFHPSGRLLFAVGRGPEVIVLDPVAGVELATLRVHDGRVFSIAFDAGGSRVFTSGEDSWIGLTDLGHLRSYLRGNMDYGLGRAGGRPDSRAGQPPTQLGNAPLR